MNTEYEQNNKHCPHMDFFMFTTHQLLLITLNYPSVGASSKKSHTLKATTNLVQKTNIETHTEIPIDTE
jgi:hypothetical protein